MNKGYMLQPVIMKGMELQKQGSSLSDEMLSIWENYAESIMRLICTSTNQQTYYFQYINFRSCQMTMMKPSDRLNLQLNYLIGIQPFL